MTMPSSGQNVFAGDPARGLLSFVMVAAIFIYTKMSLLKTFIIYKL